MGIEWIVCSHNTIHMDKLVVCLCHYGLIARKCKQKINQMSYYTLEALKALVKIYVAMELQEAPSDEQKKRDLKKTILELIRNSK